MIARLSNEEIQRMSLIQADAYTTLHPAEAWRFAKAHGKSAIHQTEKAIAYGVETGVLYAKPDIPEIA